jgi:inosine-uridine nucleoside N-ribohydrolase
MPIPVILDTDIGSDIDDTWALALLLRSPEVDLKLCVSDTGDTLYRAKLLARLLETAGRSDVTVGIGPAMQDESWGARGQAAWVDDYDLARYPGKVAEDGIGAMIDAILNSPVPVTLVCIGPVPNIAAALQREPRIAHNARFVGMHGSLRTGYGTSTEVIPEYNVKLHPAACKAAFVAPWEVTITPLDTCGLIRLEGADYQRVLNSRDILTQAVIENYRIWNRARNDESGHALDPDSITSTLFDTVAAYLAFAEDLLVMETLGVRVDEEGYTRLDPEAKPIHCATAWKDLRAFENLLAERLG